MGYWDEEWVFIGKASAVLLAMKVAYELGKCESNIKRTSPVKKGTKQDPKLTFDAGM